MEPPYNIVNANDYFCRVEYFAIGHKMLGIRASHRENPQDVFFFEFVYVFCYAGAMQWQGAKLRVGSDAEYLSFLRHLILNYDKPYEKFLDEQNYGRLYIFEGPHSIVRIVATNCNKGEQLHG
jgi:hypothetical protein